MRLFLSSYRAGNYADKLIEIFGEGANVAVITNARDYKTPPKRKIKVKEVLDFFTDLKMKPVEIDLRKYFTSQVNLANEFENYQAVWLAGGNVFLLRRALKQTGLDKILTDKVRSSAIVYGGESAGAIIAGPTLMHSEMGGDEDSPDFIAEGYKKEVIWNSLQFVDFVPVPHYQDPDYGEEIEKYIKRLDKASIPHKEMTNDQAIVIEDSKEEFLK